MDRGKKSVTFAEKSNKQKNVKKSKVKLALEKIKGKNDELKKALETYEKQDVQKDITFLKTTIKNKEIEIQQLEEQLQTNVESDEKRVIKLKENFLSVEKRLNDRLSEIEKDNEALTFQAKSVEELKMKNLNLVQELSKIEYNMKLNDEEWENKLIENQRQAVRDRLEMKKMLTTKLDEIATNYNQDIDKRLTTEIQTILKENKMLKQQIADLEDDFVALQKTSGHNKEKLHELSVELNELHKLREQKVSLDFKLREATAKLDKLETIGNDYNNLQQKFGNLNECLSEKEDTIITLTRELETQTEANGQLEEKINILNEMLKNQRSKEDNIKKEMEMFLKTFSNITTKGVDYSTRNNQCELCEQRLTLYEGIAKLCNYLHVL